MDNGHLIWNLGQNLLSQPQIEANWPKKPQNARKHSWSCFKLCQVPSLICFHDPTFLIMLI